MKALSPVFAILLAGSSAAAQEAPPPSPAPPPANSSPPPPSPVSQAPLAAAPAPPPVVPAAPPALPSTSSSPPAAMAEAPLPSGLLWILGGAALSALGGLNVGTAPVCYSHWVAAKSADLCAGLSVGVGVALLGTGIPMLVHGGRQRTEFLRFVPGVAPTKSGAAMTWSVAF